MNNLVSNISFKTIAVISVVLLIFALLYHLSYPVFIGDECIRSLVAFEMLESDNFLIPTINGSFYYFKPPLYNWFIALSFYLFGYVNEFSARVPTVIFTLLFGYCIYYFNKIYFGRKFGFLVALMVITCGRILFWDSMLGLIDIGYSMVVYVQIYLIYFLFKKEKYLQLFLITYLLTAIGFMMKGYPSLAFQALSLGVWFIYKRRFLLLLSIKHILGILLLFGIVGGYYWIYSQYNDVQNTINPLLDQAMKRTAAQLGYGEMIKHVFTYPFENLYHFLPWTFFIVLLLRKDVVKLIKKNPFIEFTALMFMTNILIYWISPEVYPRYILMLVPFVFTIFLYFFMYENTINWSRKTLKYVFNGLAIILPLIAIVILFEPKVQAVPNYQLKVFILFIALGTLSYLFFKRYDISLLVFILMLIVVRIGFDEFVLYDRKHNGFRKFYKEEALRVADLMMEEEFNIYKSSRVHFIDSYYIMMRRKKSMSRIENDFKQNQYYILDTAKYTLERFEKIDSFKVWELDRTLYIVQPTQDFKEYP